MKTVSVYLVLLQGICVSAMPLFSFRPVVDLAQRVFLSELNRRAASPYLFRSTWTTVEQIAEVGFNTFDVDLNFGVRQSLCSRENDIFLDRCAILPSSSAAMCTSRLRVSPGSAQFLALQCLTDSSSSESSSSSSEEENMVRDGSQIFRQVPGVVLCQGAVSCARLL